MTQQDADRYEVGAPPFRTKERPTLVRRTFPVGPVRRQFDDNRLTDRLDDDHLFPTVARAAEWCSTSTPSPED